MSSSAFMSWNIAFNFFVACSSSSSVDKHLPSRSTCSPFSTGKLGAVVVAEAVVVEEEDHRAKDIFRLSADICSEGMALLWLSNSCPPKGV